MPPLDIKALLAQILGGQSNNAPRRSDPTFRDLLPAPGRGVSPFTAKGGDGASPISQIDPIMLARLLGGNPSKTPSPPPTVPATQTGPGGFLAGPV